MHNGVICLLNLFVKLIHLFCHIHYVRMIRFRNLFCIFRFGYVWYVCFFQSIWNWSFRKMIVFVLFYSIFVFSILLFYFLLYPFLFYCVLFHSVLFHSILFYKAASVEIIILYHFYTLLYLLQYISILN